MQLSAFEVVSEKYVVKSNGDPLDSLKFRGKASVDIGIREILIKEDESTNYVVAKNSHVVKPQETVCVISEERIIVPDGYVAYVFLKNRLSQKGLLAFNTGIIDPGFDGPVSTVITNLSRESIELSNVEPDCLFFRVVFHKMTISGNLTNLERRKYNYEEYKRYRVEDLKKLPSHFLDPQKIRDQVDKSLHDKAGLISNRNFGWLLFALTIVCVLGPILLTVFTGFMSDKYIFQNEKIAVLEKEISDLRNEMLKMKK